MAAGRKITVEFLGNNRDLDRAMDSSASRAGRFGNALKKAGRVAALGLAAGALIAGKALFEMTKAAVADEAAQAKLANTLRKAAGATDAQIAQTEDWITTQGELYGVTDDELRPALAKLATATGDVGEAQRLAALAMDVAAGSGKSLDTVTTALQKAQNGSVGGLSRLGVATKNAAGETLSFEQIQKNLAKTYEGAAATSADTLEGKMNRLKVQMSEAGEAIGSKLIPVVSQMVDWFVAKGLPAIMQFGGWARDNLLPIFARVGEVFKSVLGGMDGDAGKNLTAVRETILNFVSIVRSLWDRFGADIMSYAKATFENVKQIIGGALQVVSGIFKTFAALLKGDWSGAWEGIKQILRGAAEVIKGIVKQLLNGLELAFRLAWGAIKGIVGGVWDGIKDIVRNGADKIVDAVRGIPGRIKDMAGNFREAGRLVIEALIDGLSKAGSFVSDIAGKVWDAVKGMLNAAIDKINAALEFTIDPPGPGTVNINPPNIPHLAKGGVVQARRGGTLAVLGEAGRDEAVIPLGSAASRRALGGVGGAQPIIIQINGALDPMAVGAQVEKILMRFTRESGRPLQVQTI